MLVDMLDKPFMHQQHVWATRYLVNVSIVPQRLPVSAHIRVNGHGKDEFVVFAIEIIEMVLSSESDISGMF